MNDFEEVKGKLDLLTVIQGETGLKMKRSHLEECPFCGGHECFTVDQAKQVFKCFQCDPDKSGGDVFTFFERYHNIDKAESLRRAALAAGVTLTEPKRREMRFSTRERIFIEAADYYHLKYNENGNGAKSYLIEKRGHREDVIKAMRVGWTDGGLVDHLRSKNFSDADITASGLARERINNGHPFLSDTFMKHLVIFPHLDAGKVLHFTVKDPEKRIEGRSTPYQLKNEYRHKDWRFYNQSALQRFNEIIVVEGENDALSVLDAGVQHVIGLIGQPSEQQIQALKSACAKKHIYLWVDNDLGGHGGWKGDKWHDGFIRQICAVLIPAGINVRIISHPSGPVGADNYVKDPDDYLRTLPEGERRKEIKRLQVEARDYITWEIGETAKLSGLDNKLKALKDRRIFAALADMVEAERLAFIEKIEELGLTGKAIQEQIEAAQELLTALGRYYASLPKKADADPHMIVSLIYRELGKSGLFYCTRDGVPGLFYKHHIYEIGNNRPFNALMKLTTGLQHTKEPGRSVWDSLASEAYNFGKKVDPLLWIHTDLAEDTVYINLNGPDGNILKVSPKAVDEIPNGLNEDGVLLASPWKIMPVNFLPDADISDGMGILSEAIFDNLTCEREQRYFVLCHFICCFLLDFAPYTGLLHLCGSTAAGKTTAAKLFSLLLYGTEHLSIEISGPASYRVSAQNPLLVLDNLEHEDITKGKLQFLLGSATRGGKEKAAETSGEKTVEQVPKALVWITAIESFEKAELINRTYDIEFENKFKGDSFVETEIMGEITKHRDLIVSAIMRFIQKDILPNLKNRRDYITILKKEHKGHSKNRSDEFLALMMLILEKVIRYIPWYQDDDVYYGLESEFGWGDAHIRKAWITYQDARARETETQSSNIIKLLDGLVREYIMKMKDGDEEMRNLYVHPEYGLEMVKIGPEVVKGKDGEDDYMRTFVEFVATPKDIVFAFDRFCKNNGIRNPYGNANIFGERLKNDRNLMEKAGWELVPSDNSNVAPHWKKIRGVYFWKFRKTIVR